MGANKECIDLEDLLPLMISSISVGELGRTEAIGQLKFAGHLIAGTMYHPQVRISRNHLEIHAAFEKKAKDLGITDQPWTKLVLDSIKPEKGRGEKPADKIQKSAPRSIDDHVLYPTPAGPREDSGLPSDSQ